MGAVVAGLPGAPLLASFQDGVQVSAGAQTQVHRAQEAPQGNQRVTRAQR